MRNVVIVGYPPVQILDVAGPLEAFSNVPGYQVQLGTPGDGDTLQTNRSVVLAGAKPTVELIGPIDTLIIAGAQEPRLASTTKRSWPGSEMPQSDREELRPSAQAPSFLPPLGCLTAKERSPIGSSAIAWLMTSQGPGRSRPDLSQGWRGLHFCRNYRRNRSITRADRRRLRTQGCFGRGKIPGHVSCPARRTVAIQSYALAPRGNFKALA